MRNTHVKKPIGTSIPTLVAAAAFALPVMFAHAQPVAPVAPVENPAAFQIGCTIQAASGFRPCDDLPGVRSCDTEASDASRPSNDSTDIAFVNGGDKPVKLYWLNFQGKRVLYEKNIPPGGRRTQQTFIGHNWVVATLGEQCISVFKTEPQSVVGDGSASIPPPALPSYEQPPPPDDTVLWTPGYWAWSDDGEYYWVPGTWIVPPIVGYLWTPGYWLTQRGVFFWHAGYWGPHIGFYGGINYGYGYFGQGFTGGSWRDGRIWYNGAVTNLGSFRSGNTYNQPAANNASGLRVSYNGGAGISAQPNPAELAAATEYHIPPTTAQYQQVQSAHGNPAMRASSNNGHPAIGATVRPGQFSNASSPASSPAAPHAGTLSITHNPSATRPVPNAGTAASPKAAPVASASADAHPQKQARAPQQQAEPPKAPAEKPAATRPRPAPHVEARPPAR
jgi:hypothetical protein